MQRNIIKEYACRTVSRLSGLWSAARIGACHGNVSVEAEQETTVKPTQEQRAALSRWETEGGRIAGPADLVGTESEAACRDNTKLHLEYRNSRCLRPRAQELS